MDKELLEQLVRVRNEFQELTEIIAWECSPKTERIFKKKIKALTELIKKIKAEDSHDN